MSTANTSARDTGEAGAGDTAADNAPSPSEAPGTSELGRLLELALLELAAQQATGVMGISGRWGGRIFLVRGRIGYVESSLVPGIEALLLRHRSAGDREEGTWPGLLSSLRQGVTPAVADAAAQVVRSRSTSTVEAEIMRRNASADAALAVLGDGALDQGAILGQGTLGQGTLGQAAMLSHGRSETARPRARFRPGERHWCEPMQTLSVAQVLAEVDRRRVVLAGMALDVQPARPVRRTPHLPASLSLDRIQLTATQWNIVRLADGRNTPLDIAWMLGHGVFATTVAAHQLARIGVLSTDPGVAGSPPTTFLRAVR